MNASLRALALAAALLGPAVVRAAEQPVQAPTPRPTAAALSPRLDAVEQALRGAEENLHSVETQYTQRAEPDDDEALARRYSDGEIHYQLGDWPAASVLFYDLVSDPRFRSHPRYPDALFYLADALLEQRNDIGARMYLRELLALPSSSGHYREALSRYLTVAGRLNYYDGIEEYVARARALSGGQLPPEIAYVHAKWLFRRTDLSPADRIAQARAAFTPLARSPNGPFRFQAAYHLGVLSVQEGDFPAAITRFQQLATPPSAQAAQVAPGRTGPRRSTPTPEEQALRVRELALMSLGRLLYETGRFDEALDHYGQVPRDSESFPDSLYESAWVHVRQGDYQQAKNALDILVLVAPDSQLASEGRILQGNLLQKLRRYDEATDTYTRVIDIFRPAREQVDALLGSHTDPVAYFDKLLVRTDGPLDMRSALTPLALKYATTQREVEDAVRMVEELDSSRRGREEAAAIARRILDALDTRGLESFPELQEANTRADAVDTALAQADAELVRVETLALEGVLTPAERARLAEARAAREALERRFSALPTTLKALEARRERMQRRVDEVDLETHRLDFEVQSLHAIAASVRKWVEDSRPHRRTPPDEEREFLLQLQAEVQTLKDLQAELTAVRARLADERNAVDTTLAGERELRAAYADALRREHALLAAAEPRADADAVATLRRSQAARGRLDGMRGRVTAARAVVRERVRMVEELDSSRRGREEAAAIARRILDALDTRGLESFPELQEANTRADAVDTALAQADAELVRVETLALEGVLTPAERARLAEARAAREALERRFSALPTTLKALEARRERMQRRVDEVDLETHRLDFEVQSLHAIAASVRKWVEDSRPHRRTPPDEEREFLLQLQAEVQTLKDLQAELTAVRARLADERNAVDTTLAGERELRAAYADALRREHALLAAAEPRADADAVATLRRSQAARGRLDGMRGRVTAARAVVRERLERQGRVIREKVVAEQQRLERYEAELAAVSGDARQLMGRVAYDSVRRVRQQFYDLVLKADVGLVDVAFNEKQDKTTAIQTLSMQKDEALRELDAEFQDVLSEVKE
ncbi:tetratricopeptide repeat protein [Corallococcus macrosporus]|uniref:Uncharacterized protein n=1 Tax=Myxococcus fulvus (strain ATCC BAA-855 / HW-1) TaxID=483219 RepID=F8CP11_MYXFH|nr:tetratricopeptide repeat protein [Corallococcus macrosporus]AEI65390.1 hypothetical protein LILAB_17440 [Corallococcus macrosporus]